jgi:tRNA1(Val) A37 N6-methylase TrmN6
MRQPSKLVLDGETVDDLQNGLFIIQKNGGFKFGVDAVLLADFAKEMRAERCIDLCTGSGIVPLLLSVRTKAERIDGIEIQRDIADMARRSVEYNGLSERIFIENSDLRSADEIYGKRVFDAVTCNPPYMKCGAALTNSDDNKLISRHEIMCTLEDVLRVSAALLKVGGHFYMVHRPSRLADIICGMRNYKIEPKRMRLVCPSAGKPPKLVLVEGIFCGGAELRVDAPLVVFNADGTETDEVRAIYNRYVRQG